ncbi:MAG: Ig-like domain-containing protein [Candidatus Faecivicinus sp.]
MKTAFGKLTLMALVLALCLLLLAPMRSGVEDRLKASISQVSLDPGETVKVSYELRTESAQTVAYSTDDAGVATVDQRGLITAVAPGKTKVRLTAQGGAAAAIDVEVSGVPVKTFSLNTHELKLNKGDVSGLSFQFNAGATGQYVTWMSADPEIASVDTAGRIAAVGGGQTWITATTAGGLTDSALVYVNVRANAVQIAPGDLTVGVGATFQLGTRYLPEDATDEPVSWKSSAPQVLSVDGSGLTRAVSAGSATITVTTRDGLTASTDIHVEPASKDFQISPTEASIERGDTCALEVQFINADGQVDESMNHHVEWSSSDPSVATVENGIVTGVATGIAAISASADGFQATCTVRVHTSVQEVSLNITEQTLYREQTAEPFQLKATIVPADADDPKLIFTTDNPLVANVSDAGLVTMTGGYGTAVISVEAASGAKATCTVNVIVPSTGNEEETQP